MVAWGATARTAALASASSLLLRMSTIERLVLNTVALARARPPMTPREFAERLSAVSELLVRTSFPPWGGSNRRRVSEQREGWEESRAENSCRFGCGPRSAHLCDHDGGERPNLLLGESERIDRLGVVGDEPSQLLDGQQEAVEVDGGER